MGLPTIPYDPWFQTSFVPGYDDRYNPLDDMPIATNDRFDMYGSSDAHECRDALAFTNSSSHGKRSIAAPPSFQYQLR